MSAASTKSFQVYSASAGAGKTFSLVRAYLILCLRYDNPNTFSRILAITFTIKAAAEMKSRVLMALDGFRRDEVPSSQLSLFKSVKEELQLDDSTLRLRAEKTLKAMLHDYGSLGISTIDKFTYRLVRTFSHDLGLSSNFEVELDSQELHKQSVDLLLDESGKNAKLTQVLERFIDRKMDEEKSWKLEYQLTQMANHLGNEGSYEVLDKLATLPLEEFIDIRKKLELRKREIMAPISAFKREAEQLISNIPQNYFSYSDVPNFIRKLSSKPISGWFPGARLARQIEAETFVAKSATQEIKSVIEPITPALLHWFKQWQDFESSLRELIYIDLILSDFDGTAVLQEILRKLKEYKEANNVESLSTFNKLIHQSLESLPVPYIYERVGEKYRHYFIDEFQDTSVLQWKNLQPLIHNSVASGGTTMIVGDGKQSIYRWRGGEPEQFLSLIERAKEPQNNGGDLSYALEHVSLDYNWRSGNEITQFNNDLFQKLSDKLEFPVYKDLYKAGIQEPKGHSGGYISLQFLKGSGQDAKQDILNSTLDKVRTCLEDGFVPGDIALLVRGKEEGELVVRKLTEAGISVVSVDSLKLENSSAVRAIVGFIRTMLFPSHVEARMEWVEMMFQSGVWKFNSEELHQSLYAAADAKTEAWSLWLKERGLSTLSQKINAASLYEWGETAAREMGLFNDQNADPFVQFFLDEMYEFGARNGHNPSDFLNWWDEKGKDKSISVPKSSQAVQVMTIHKSKGLEFPVVIFPFAKFKTSSDHNPARWVSLDENKYEGLPAAQMSMSKDNFNLLGAHYPAYSDAYLKYKREVQFDNFNLLYVTMTRAIERLYVISEFKKVSSFSTVNEYLIDYLEQRGFAVHPDEVYVFGTASGPLRDHRLDESQSTVEYRPEPRSLRKLYSHNWRNRVKLNQHSDEPGNKLSQQPKKWGNTIHDLLAKTRHADEVDNVIQRELTSGRLPSEAADSLKHIIHSVVSHRALVDTFHPDEFYVERDWLGGGEVHRPDRISRKGDLWTVTDYKTGEKKPSHSAQVKDYAQMLTDRGLKVCAQLVYIGDDIEVVNVPLNVEDGEQLKLL